MFDKRRWPLIGAGVPLGLFLLLVAAWGIDSLVTSDQVVRGVVVGDTELGGLTEADVVNAAADLTTRLGAQPLAITVGDTTVQTDPVTLGASIDGQRLADDALAARRGGFFLLRPIRWVGTFFSDSPIEAHHSFDAAMSDTATLELINPLLSDPTDPYMTLTNGSLAVVPGSDGAIVDPGLVGAKVPDAIEQGAPFSIEVQSTPVRPDLKNAPLEAVATEANAATAEPVGIQVLDVTAQIEGTDIREWISLDLSSGTPDWIIDPNKAQDALQPLFPLLGVEGQQASFNVVDGIPVIIPATESVICCDANTVDLLKAGLLAPETPVADVNANDDDDEDAATVITAKRFIRLEPTLSDGAEGVTELESLGIIEEISTFTTRHDCCQNRVTNIQLMAEIVQGYIIRPGETFDLNEVVGKRDTARGFKPAGAIASGNIEDQVGGGVSQFTTTIFNAAFFGGLDLDEYQSHSIYFSRYPKGREATISWPKPDFIITNPTEYGILVWPTWTDNSITVTFYSTKNVEVFCIKTDDSRVSGAKGCDESIRRSAQGECTRYTTKRERVFANGDVVNDSIFAVYRPGTGLDCAGNSTVPTTTDPDATSSTVEGETTTTVEGETTTTIAGETTTTVETTPITPSSTDP